MLTTQTLLARQKAASQLQAVPVSESDIPKEFPKPGQYGRDDVDAGTVKPYQWFASFVLGQCILASEWRKLNHLEQNFVEASLASRGLVLYRRGGRLYAISKDQADGPAEIKGSQTPFEFSVPYDDRRISFTNDIHLIVYNANNEREARKMLGQFLRDLMRVGFHVH